MPKNSSDSGTDAAWEEWGRRDPYFGVITDPKFRRPKLNLQTKTEFFDTGRPHVEHVLQMIRKFIEPEFKPQRILDFGCGVGRLLFPFAAIGEEIVGLDVSASMLEEARRNCEERGLHNVRLLMSDDGLSAVQGVFDLVHSCIVLQHIPILRGRDIFAQLLRCVRPNGVCAIQLTYAKAQHAPTYGVAPAVVPVTEPTTTECDDVDPEIQMNSYNVNELMFLMQRNGVKRFATEFTDHGGELGLFLFFQLPGDGHPRQTI